jgi:hypothetical protein
MNPHLTALLDAIRSMQDELLAHGQARRRHVTTPELTIARLCDILSEPQVVEAMVTLSVLDEVRREAPAEAQRVPWRMPWRH